MRTNNIQHGKKANVKLGNTVVSLGEAQAMLVAVTREGSNHIKLSHQF